MNHLTAQSLSSRCPSQCCIFYNPYLCQYHRNNINASQLKNPKSLVVGQPVHTGRPLQDITKYRSPKDMVLHAISRDHSAYMGSANERRRYIVTSSVVGWAHTLTLLREIVLFHCVWIRGPNLAISHARTGDRPSAGTAHDDVIKWKHFRVTGP